MNPFELITNNLLDDDEDEDVFSNRNKSADKQTNKVEEKKQALPLKLSNEMDFQHSTK